MMLPSLRVGQVRPVVLVDGQAEATFEASDVVLEEVRVLVEVDGLECEFAKAFTTVSVSCRG